MTIRQTDNYIKACMNTWLLCEACIHSETQSNSPNKKLLKAWSNCGQSCISIVAGIISDTLTTKNHILDCFLYCRECYNECMLHKQEDIEECGKVCDNCAETIKELLFFHLN